MPSRDKLTRKWGRDVARERPTTPCTAAPVFLVGSAVRAGLHGSAPDLKDLDDGDPKFAIVFRRVYATLLDRCLGCPSEKVLGGKFEPLTVL